MTDTKTVGREPTPEMIEAGVKDQPHLISYEEAEAVWIAMHDAAPDAEITTGANGQEVGILTIDGARVEVDIEIAPIVRALNEAGVATKASCSGHGHRPGKIVLCDGREIIIARNFDEARRIDCLFPLDINGDPYLPATAVVPDEVRAMVERLRAMGPRPDDGGEARANKLLYLEAADMLERFSATLGDFLATIHRDGGHYVAEHGWERAVAAAIQLSSERIVAAERLSSPGYSASDLNNLIRRYSSPPPAADEGVTALADRLEALAANPATWNCYAAEATDCMRQAAVLIRHTERILSAMPSPVQPSELCDDCPPIGYPTDKMRCEPCPRRLSAQPISAPVSAPSETPEIGEGQSS